MHKLIFRLFLFLLTCASVPAAYAHGGVLNAVGCHNNRKTGYYHCHNPPQRLRNLSNRKLINQIQVINQLATQDQRVVLIRSPQVAGKTFKGARA